MLAYAFTAVTTDAINDREYMSYMTYRHNGMWYRILIGNIRRSILKSLTREMRPLGSADVTVLMRYDIVSVVGLSI
jgi:hypothetical protein